SLSETWWTDRLVCLGSRNAICELSCNQQRSDGLLAWFEQNWQHMD
uniref:UBR-type domain-containing protein n=1 Tax=Parascaris univalens TaxID=6257 RepID=A0A914ZQT7_PARUN